MEVKEREENRMPIIDQSKCPVKTGSIYPEPYAAMMKGRFAAQGAELTASTPAGCTGLVRSELASWTALFQSLGIKPE